MRNLWHILTRTYHQFTVKSVGSIFMTWMKSIREIVVTVLSLVLALYQEGRSYLISCYPMVRAIGVCLSQRFSKNIFLDPKCKICQSTSYSCGTVLAIGLLFILLIGWLV